MEFRKSLQEKLGEHEPIEVNQRFFIKKRLTSWY